MPIQSNFLPTYSLGTPKNITLEQLAKDFYSFTEQTASDNGIFNLRQNWLQKHLDHDNIDRIYTNYCEVMSAAGETVIEGPLLLMYDKQATPVLRLKMGYDAASGDFVFELYNSSGVKTVGIDASGDGTFTGSITGSTITGGTVRTSSSGERIELTGDTLTTYNSSNQKNGPYIYPGDGDIAFYKNGTAILSVGLPGTNTVSIQSVGSYDLLIYDPHFSGFVVGAGTRLSFNADVSKIQLLDDDLTSLSSVDNGRLPSGTYANKPSSPSVGQCYVDTTNHIIIHWDGSNWYDAVGNVLP